MDGVRVPVQHRSRLTRDQLLAAAAELFAAKGYTRTSIKEIAAAAGSAVGSFYAYFPDKAALFLELCEHYYQQIFSLLRQAASRKDLEQLPVIPGGKSLLIRAMIDTLYAAHDIEPGLHREISLLVQAGASATGGLAADSLEVLLAQKVAELDRQVLEWLEQLLVRYLAIDDAAAAAKLVFRVSEELVHRLKQYPETLPEAETTLQALHIMLCAYLLKPAGNLDGRANLP